MSLVFASYNDFLFKSELDIFESECTALVSLLNEEESSGFIEGLKVKIEGFLSKVTTPEQAGQFLDKISKLVPSETIKKYILYFTLSLLLGTTAIGSHEIISSVHDKHTKEIVKEIDHKSDKEFESLCEKLAFTESTDRWDVAKRTQALDENGKPVVKNGKPVYVSYIGKYQLGYLSLKEIGRTDITYDKFVKNPSIFPEAEQDAALKKLYKKNKHYLRNWMHHIGKKYNGIEVTLSGILSAAHLVGNNNVKIFLKHHGKVDPKDGNGTPCSSYMKKFGNFKILI
jgi:hypothetical protein